MNIKWMTRNEYLSQFTKLRRHSRFIDTITRFYFLDYNVQIPPTNPKIHSEKILSTIAEQVPSLWEPTAVTCRCTYRNTLSGVL